VATQGVVLLRRRPQRRCRPAARAITEGLRAKVDSEGDGGGGGGGGGWGGVSTLQADSGVEGQVRDACESDTQMSGIECEEYFLLVAIQATADDVAHRQRATEHAAVGCVQHAAAGAVICVATNGSQITVGESEPDGDGDRLQQCRRVRRWRARAAAFVHRLDADGDLEVVHVGRVDGRGPAPGHERRLRKNGAARGTAPARVNQSLHLKATGDCGAPMHIGPQYESLAGVLECERCLARIDDDLVPV